MLAFRIQLPVGRRRRMQEAPRKAPETKLEPRPTPVRETSETSERAARDTEEREIDGHFIRNDTP